MPPSMIFIAGSSKEGQSTSKGPEKLFVGDVWLDSIFNDEQNTIANVTFVGLMILFDALRLTFGLDTLRSD